MKALNLLLSILVSLLLGALVLEGGLRLIGLGPPRTLNAFDPVQGWRNKPGATIVRRSVEGFDVRYAFNRFGMRDDEVEPAKAPGTTRVVALGDSFTLGLTVSRADLFVDLLERWWRAEGRAVEVLNTGTEAYSTDQEAAWLLANGDEWRPDVVLLFPYENDIYWNGETSYTGLEKPRFTAEGELEARTLTDAHATGWLARTALGRLFARRAVTAPRKFSVGSAQVLEEFAPLLDSPPDFLADPLARTRGALRGLAQKCAQLHARLLVAPIPSHSAADPAYAPVFAERAGLSAVAWSADRPVDTFLDAARAEGIETLDVREAFRARTAAEGDLYFSKDWHINPAGNRAFAELLHQKLDELGWLPAATAVSGLPASDAGPGAPRRWPWVFLGLWAALGTCYSIVYKKAERFPLGFLKVGALLAVIFTIALGGGALIGLLPQVYTRLVLILVVLAILGFVLFKLGHRLATITELVRAFIGRGHWYLMPLVTVLLTIGSLLVVAASSPLVAPFIYTLF